ncbi:MAG: NADH-quinone oxidoreductase subunit M [Pseudomonadota bacterium]
MFADLPLLSLLIWTPVIGGLVVLWLGDRRLSAARGLALGVSLLTFVLSLGLWTGFNVGSAQMQFLERALWIPTLGADYALGVDGLSMPLIILTAFMTVFVIFATKESVSQRPAAYMGAFLVMEGLMIGVFAALDALLFYIFWEAMLIPMFLIIGIWGGPRRIYATVKFFLFTFLGSVLMLVAFIYLYQQGGSFDVLGLQRLPLSATEQTWIFLAFLVAFAVKVPMWPVHTWLPDAHVEAPTGGSVILAAITLKMGAYGFLRYALPIAPDAAAEMAGLMATLSLIAVVYVGLVAMVQEDMKKLIAYSSIAHMGFVTLGFFLPFWGVANPVSKTPGLAMAMTGGMVQMISHGFISGAMFLSVGVLYDRMHTRRIAAYGGVATRMPVFAAFFVLFAMANSGLPGTSGFVGEFLVILASFQANPWIAFLAALTLILGASYSLWLVKRVAFGPVTNSEVSQLNDVTPREFLMLGLLALTVLGLGVWPRPLLAVIEPSVQQLLLQILPGKL